MDFVRQSRLGTTSNFRMIQIEYHKQKIDQAKHLSLTWPVSLVVNFQAKSRPGEI